MTDIINGFSRIKDLPTTKVEVLKASHDDPTEAIVRVTRAEFDPMTGEAIAAKQSDVTREGALIHRKQLKETRDRLVSALADFDAFIAAAQDAIAQWLIDNPNEEPENG